MSVTKSNDKKSKRPNIYLKRQREIRGWSQQYVARQIETNAFTVGRWERGTNRPGAYFRAKLCALFELDAEDLGFLEDANATMSEQSMKLVSPLLPVYDPAIPPPLLKGRELIGRDEILHHLKTHLLTRKSLALSALNGLPGVGKTALAHQLAHDKDIQAHFQHGILWARVGQHPNMISLLSNWGTLLALAHFEIAGLTNLTEWGNALRNVIGERSILIVLDDVWRIEDAFALKVGGPQCAYLLTTRIPQVAVQFTAEHATVVRELDTSDSLALLKRFAPTVVTREPEAALALVHIADGLPLALTIMGRYLQLHAHSDQPRRIKAALEHLQNTRERLQLTQSTSAAERSPSLPVGTSFSLQAIIALSTQQLLPEVRQALRALAILAPKPNTFSEAVALFIANVSTKVLNELEDSGLLEVSGTNRYSLHQTIADYACLDAPDPRAEQRLVLYNRDFVLTHGKDYARVERAEANIRTALSLAMKHEMHKPFIESVLALAPFWEARGLYDLAKTHLQHALAIHQLVTHSSKEDVVLPSQEFDNLLKARLHLALGRIAERCGTLEFAEHHYDAGIVLAKQYNNHEILSSLLAN